VPRLALGGGQEVDAHHCEGEPESLDLVLPGRVEAPRLRQPLDLVVASAFPIVDTTGPPDADDNRARAAVIAPEFERASGDSVDSRHW
jgi:hypothetical protein